jgi:hypothetical protein
MKTIIVEPAFDALGTDASKWVLITHNGVEMKPTLQDSTLRLDISRTTGANWQGELCYAPFPVLVGEIFTVSFSVKAERPFTFSVWLGQQDPPHKSLVSDENHFGEQMMTSEWKTFTHAWKPVLSEKAARLDFVFGQIDNVVEIRDVELNKLNKQQASATG